MTLGVPNGPQALSIAHDHTSCSLIRVAKTPNLHKVGFQHHTRYTLQVIIRAMFGVPLQVIMVSLYIYIYTYIYTHMYIYIHIYICVCVCLLVYYSLQVFDKNIGPMVPFTFPLARRSWTWGSALNAWCSWASRRGALWCWKPRWVRTLRWGLGNCVGAGVIFLGENV